jgi:hypothetical protein
VALDHPALDFIHRPPPPGHLVQKVQPNLYVVPTLVFISTYEPVCVENFLYILLDEESVP